MAQLRKKKLITKRILVNVPFEELFSNGFILVENCSNCWAMLDTIKIDMVAYRIIHILFDEYQKDGEIPDIISYHI